MLRVSTIVSLAVLGLVAPDAHARDLPRADPRPRAAASASNESGVAFARDAARGVPSLLWSPSPVAPRAGVSMGDAARFHLDRHRATYKVGRAALAGAKVMFAQQVGRHTVVGLRQTVDGVELLRADIRVLLDDAQRLVAVAGAPHPGAHHGSAQAFTLSRAEAAGRALADLYGPAYGGLRLKPGGPRRGGYERFALADASDLRLRAPARVKPVYAPVGEALVAAYYVEVQAQMRGRAGADAFAFVVAAADGRVLDRRDLTAHESYQYRVWADPDGDLRPTDGPLEDRTPHPTGLPNLPEAVGVAPVLVAVDGLNHNADDLPDPWLPAGATETLGNNVDAYVDHTNPTGLNLDMNEFRADVTAPGVFDRTYDVALEPLSSQGQSKAAIVQLFYTINWLHDWWYDSGFTEVTGNAQAQNYGRGGEEGDVLLAEAQDAALVGTRNNANMSTPADGDSPRMQMYLWTAVKNAKLTVQPMNKEFVPGTAAFGPQFYDLTAPLRLLDDGVGPNANDGCTAPINDLAGAIALVDRGTCTFETKVNSAQNAGAVGVIIANNQAGNINPGADPNQPDPVVPTQAVTQAEGVAIKAALQNGAQSATMFSAPPGPERDGTIDNGIVAHEFGHYLHHRLEIDAGNKQSSAMSEGWGDFNALLMILRDGDDLDGVYSASTYANFDKTGYFGIRRVPTSTDMTKNALTFKHIQDGEALPANHPLSGGGPNSEVHNAGEVWATMVWEAYIALHKAHAGDMTFAEVHRLFSDYLVTGMLMTPGSPTYVDQRNAILLAAGAESVDDFLTMAAAFAKRGAGSCAVAPPPFSTDFKGVIEDYELRPNGKLLDVKIADEPSPCDKDDVIDVGELGTITVTVTNHGAAEMPAGAVVEILDPDPALVFPEGPSTAIKSLGPLESMVVQIPVTVDEALVDWQKTPITVRLSTPGGCVETQDRLLMTVLNGDVEVEASRFDDVETPVVAWTIGGTNSESIWGRSFDVDGYFWHGNDVGTTSDTWLATPALQVSDVDPLVVTLEHAYSFEYSDNTFWDGGLIEFTVDDGATWTDVATLIDPGYGGAINSMVNPLNGREAFVDKNPGYPDRETLVLDFGTQLAGQTAKLRFRIGTDAAAGGPGWDIDDIDIDGVKNTPFAQWIPDQTVCEQAGETTTTGDESTSTSDTSTGDDTSTASTSSTSTGDDTTAASTGDDSSSGGESTTNALTSGSTSEGSTSFPVTTGEPATTAVDSDSGGQESGPDPTTGGGGPGTVSAGEESSGGGSSSGEDPGETVDDGGCGCAAGEPTPWALQVLPWLGLLGLRRRRSR